MAGTERPRVFCDADVLIAASASATGASYLVLHLGELRLIDVVSSAQARLEAERNLRNKLPAAVAAFRVLAEAFGRWVDDPPPRVLTRMKNWADAKDVPILAAAVEAGCPSLVTFNTRDYHPPKSTIRSETPSDFVRRLREHIALLSE